MRISIVINGDTRPGTFGDNSEQGIAGSGTKSVDFLKEGVENKLNFFKGYEVESVLYVDIHESLSKEDLWDMSQRVDNLILHKHVEYLGSLDYFTFHRDLNYLFAVSQTRGDFIVHFDWDTMAFRNEGSDVVDRWMGWLNEGKCDYISYPSNFSPRASVDPDFTYDWASTRFFMCKRSMWDHTEILKCLEDTQYLYDKYAPKDSKKRCGWIEHVQGMIAGQGRVFYPPLDVGDHMVFSWSKYVNGVMNVLNMVSYAEVLKYVQGCAGIHYPCDVAGRPI